MAWSMDWMSARFCTGPPAAVRQPLRFQPCTHSDEHLIAYWESAWITRGSSPGWERTASRTAMSSAIWLVPDAWPPLALEPSWLAHAQPMAPPGLRRQEPSVLTVITGGDSALPARGSCTRTGSFRPLVLR